MLTETWIYGLMESDVQLSFGVIFIIMAAYGLGAYPTLCDLRARAISLKHEISTVRSAHYSEVEGSYLIGGSLDNLQQSSKLSDYISEYAKVKAEANAMLAKMQAQKRNAMYVLFGRAWFYPVEVLEMKPLK